MCFKRARNDKNIEIRKKEIINAASKIYDLLGYNGVTFTSISEHTKFTRPTIYKYFNTKEEILLKILLSDMYEWISVLIKSFKLNKIYSVNEIAEIWAKSINNNFRLMNLYSVLFTSIEKNVSIEALVEFKKQSFILQTKMVNLLKQLFPNSNEDNILEFLLNHMSLVLGLYPMCNPCEIQSKAMELAKVNYPKNNFLKSFKLSIFQLMYCLDKGINLENY
jgi:AcrR family transcriptional regulator